MFIQLKVEKDKNVLHIDAFNGVSHKGTLIFRGPGHQKDWKPLVYMTQILLEEKILVNTAFFLFLTESNHTTSED